MSWEARNALGLIDLLHKALNGPASGVHSKIRVAKQLWAAGRQQVAFKLLMELAQDSPLTSAQQDILQTLDWLASQAEEHHNPDSRDSRLFRLEQQVRQLQEERQTDEVWWYEKEGQRQRQEQELLLSWAAHVFCGLVEAYVFQDKGTDMARHPTLTDIANMARRPAVRDPQSFAKPGMDDMQRTRWRSVAQVMAEVQPVQRFLDAGQVLRQLDCQPGHRSPARVSPESLLYGQGGLMQCQSVPYRTMCSCSAHFILILPR